MRVLFAFLALLVTVSAQGLTGPKFWITKGNGSNFTFAEIGNDPALTLNVGTTYQFILNVSMPNHPFGFTASATAQVSNFSSPSLGGVTTSGSCKEHTSFPFSWLSTNDTTASTDPCIVSITPAQVQAGTVFYYRCPLHPEMIGALTVPAASTSTPTTTVAPGTPTPAPGTPTPTAPPKSGAAQIVPAACALIAVAINALFSA